MSYWNPNVPANCEEQSKNYDIAFGIKKPKDKTNYWHWKKPKKPSKIKKKRPFKCDLSTSKKGS